MISRRTTIAIAEIYSVIFSHIKGGSRYQSRTVTRDRLYDFLFEQSYPSLFCNLAKKHYYPRFLKEWIMQIHTGESICEITPDWTWDQRKKRGQQYLEELAEDIIREFDRVVYDFQKQRYEDLLASLHKNLELDGYQHKDGQLIKPEEDVLDVQEEMGVLEVMFKALDLDNQDTAFHHLGLSEHHYLESRWDDSISNSRKFLEIVLRSVASKYSFLKNKKDLSEKIMGQPREVRSYLQMEGLIEKKEEEALAKNYSLLSEYGGHPYMAEKDQARLLRHIALTFCQFIMLRLEGSLR